MKIYHATDIHLGAPAASLFTGRVLRDYGFGSNVNKSAISTLSLLANFSNPATDGAFTPRSTRLMNSTEQPILFASFACVIRCALRRPAIVDDVAIIGSANLTDDAFNRNMELGMLVRGQATVENLAEHCRELIRAKILVPVKPAENIWR